jgi:hypothetical protein
MAPYKTSPITATQGQSRLYHSSQSRQFVEIPLREPGRILASAASQNEDVTALANAMAVDALWILGLMALDDFTAAYICPIARGSLSLFNQESQT